MYRDTTGKDFSEVKHYLADGMNEAAQILCKRSEEQGLTTPQFTLPDGFKVCLWRETAHVTAHVADYVEELIRRLVLVLFGEMDMPTEL